MAAPAEVIDLPDGLYRTLLAGLGAGIVYCDIEDVIIHVNESFCTITGYSIDQLVGQPVYAVLLPPKEQYLVREQTTRRLQGISETYRLRIRRADGQRVWVEVNATPVRSSAGNIIGSVGAINDVSEQVKAEQTVQTQREFLREIIDASPNLIFAVDSTGRFRLANKLFAELSGRSVEEIVGLTNKDLCQNAQFAARYDAENATVFRTQQPLIISEGDMLDPTTGELRWFHALKRLLHTTYEDNRILLCVATEITERKLAEAEARRLERQLFHSQKMEAIGQLAAGVAHDLNNALAAVVGHLQLLKIGGGTPAEVSQSVEVALTGCQRASSLIEQLLGFSRQGRYNLERICLQKSVAETLDFVSKIIDKNIKIEVGGDETESYVDADPSQLQQSITNLIINARQAMPQGGVISIAFDRQVIANPAPFNRRAKAGTYFTVMVRDTGVGIPSTIIDKVFEPFFTTKSDRQGTGLGLAMVYGMMQNHGGWVDVRSEVGVGTTFTLFFPVVAGAAPDRGTGRVTSLEAPGVATLPGKILVIDDEPTLVDLAVQFFAKAGIGAQGFSDPRAAITWFAGHSAEVALVIMDMKMPGCDGRVCFAELRKIRPDVEVVILSGFAEDNEVKEVMRSGAKKLFQKPLRYPDLVGWVAERLRGVKKT